MEDFPFKLNINYKNNIEEGIKPPFNFSLLTDLIKEKLNLKKIFLFYFDINGIEIEIKNNNDYINFIEYSTNQNVKEIEIIIKENKEKKKENKNEIKKNKNISLASNNEIGDFCEYDYFGDTRNRKGMINQGYTKHNIGYKEQKRIYYIKEKKEMQRKEQKEKEKLIEKYQKIEEYHKKIFKENKKKKTLIFYYI